MFGIRSAARNASAAARQPEVVRDHALAHEAGDARQEDARTDRERAADAAAMDVGSFGHHGDYYERATRARPFHRSRKVIPRGLPARVPSTSTTLSCRALPARRGARSRS